MSSSARSRLRWRSPELAEPELRQIVALLATLDRFWGAARLAPDHLLELVAGLYVKHDGTHETWRAYTASLGVPQSKTRQPRTRCEGKEQSRCARQTRPFGAELYYKATSMTEFTIDRTLASEREYVTQQIKTNSQRLGLLAKALAIRDSDVWPKLIAFVEKDYAEDAWSLRRYRDVFTMVENPDDIRRMVSNLARWLDRAKSEIGSDEPRIYKNARTRLRRILADQTGLRILDLDYRAASLDQLARHYHNMTEMREDAERFHRKMDELIARFQLPDDGYVRALAAARRRGNFRVISSDEASDLSQGSDDDESQ